MNLNEKIQNLRKQVGISQEQLAERLNVTRQAISKWETGECLPDIENILQLSDIFGVSVDYLLKNQQTEVSPSSDSSYIIEALEEENSDTGFRFSLDFNGILYPLATLVYLVIGFYWGLWHPGWIVFIFAWLIGDAISYFKTGRFNISIYGVAAVAYITLGVITGNWRHGWLLFVAAWVISSAVRPTKSKKKKKKKKDNNERLQ